MISLTTPIGPVTAPRHISDEIEPLSDVDLLRNLYTPNNEFVNPFVYQEIEKRRRNRILKKGKQWSLPNFTRYSEVKAYLDSLQ